MGALQSAFPIIFLVALCIIIGVAAFIFLSNRRKREGFTEFAQRHGWTYAARPSGKAADLFVVLEANIVALAGQTGARRSGFSDLVAGVCNGRDFRYFCHASMKMNVTTGTAHSNSAGMSSSSIDGMDSSTTCCLQMDLRGTRGLPDLWVKKHAPLDFAYRLTGLQKVELQDPAMNRTFRVFCLDRHSIAPFPQSEILACLGNLDPSEILQVHDGYLLLTSRSTRGMAWIEEKLELLSRLGNVIEKERIPPAR
jgi:hypothetical protein